MYYKQSDVDKLCNELMSNIERLRNFNKIKEADTSIVVSAGEEHVSGDANREELLENVIRETIMRLEGTKKYFKSKTVKEVKEKLIKVLEE